MLEDKYYPAFTCLFQILLPHSNPPQYQQDDQNQKNQSHSTAGIGSPALRVRPRRQYTNENKNQNNNQYCKHVISPFFGCRTGLTALPQVYLRTQNSAQKIEIGTPKTQSKIHSIFFRVIRDDRSFLSCDECLRQRPRVTPVPALPLRRQEWSCPDFCC